MRHIIIVSILTLLAFNAQAQSADKLIERAHKCETDTQCEKVTDTAQRYQATLEKRLVKLEQQAAKDAEKDAKRNVKLEATRKELDLLKQSGIANAD